MKLTKKLILASNSPRRKEILRASGFDFEVIVRPTSEAFDTSMPYEKVPQILAQKKAECYEDIDKTRYYLKTDRFQLEYDKVLIKFGYEFDETNKDFIENMQNIKF
jgi:septum formation protein